MLEESCNLAWKISARSIYFISVISSVGSKNKLLSLQTALWLSESCHVDIFVFQILSNLSLKYPVWTLCISSWQWGSKISCSSWNLSLAEEKSWQCLLSADSLKSCYICPGGNYFLNTHQKVWFKILIVILRSHTAFTMSVSLSLTITLLFSC